MKWIRNAIALCLGLAVCLVCIKCQTVSAIETSAKAYVLLNADTLDVIAAGNAHKRLPMASTTKIMTALILAELNTPDKEIVTTKEMVTVEGSSMGLKAGDSVSYYELLVGMLLPSGNDAANTAAICVAGSAEKFADLMNKKAKDIGMSNTHFVTPSGLDAKEHYSTAYDMALLTAEALKNDTIREICSKDKITVTFGDPPYQRTLYNHNKLLGRYEYCIGVKTGFTKKSGRCLVSAAEKDGCRVIAVTLNDPDDWDDHEKLLDYGLSIVKNVDITKPLPFDTVKVVGGEKERVSVAAPRCYCGGDSELSSNVTVKYSLKPFVYAPIQSGQTVGTVEYFYGGKILRTTEIITLEGVDQKAYAPSFFELFKNYLYILLECFV